MGRGGSIGFRSGYCGRQRRAENRIVDAPVAWAAISRRNGLAGPTIA